LKDLNLPEDKLKKYYNLFLELGIIMALVIAIVAFKVQWQPTGGDKNLADDQETVDIKEVVQTKHEKDLPPPPRPQVPKEVPNDKIVEQGEININTELNMDQKLDIPPPPDNGQEGENNEEEQVFVIVEQPPKLIGGLQNLQKKIQYPEMARKAGIEGRVILQFIVNKDGEVEDPRVVRGIGGGCDKEALRVIKKAKFEPGRQRGRPVRVRYSMPIVFKLDKSS
jgi:protein TonB